MDPQDNYAKLLRDIRRRPLVLFVGAGINGMKELSWVALLKTLCDAALQNVFSEEGATDAEREQVLASLIPDSSANQLFDVYQKASLIKQLLGKRYIPVLQAAIYPDGIRDELRRKWQQRARSNECPTLFNVARLCCESNGLVRAVVTFNYDNYLSMVIEHWNRENRKRTVRAVNAFLQDTNAHEPSRDSRVLPIYHVHGYIAPPWEVRRRQGGSVVLSYDEYFQNMLEPNSWQTTTQLHFLMNFTCAFVGASLTDMNMLRMLSSAKKYGVWQSPAQAGDAIGRYAFMVRGDEPDNTPARIRDRLRTTVLHSAGVSPIYVTKEELGRKLLALAGNLS